MRSVNGPKASRRRRTPRIAHQQSDNQDLRGGPRGLLGRPRQYAGPRWAFREDKRGRTMTSEQVTVILAERVMTWGVATDHFLMGDRSWIVRQRFQPTAGVVVALKIEVVL